MLFSKYRKQMFATLALAAAPACLTDEDATAREATALEVTTITFAADNSVAAEHCRVHNDRLAAWPAGSQLLIYRGTRLRGMCTVEMDHPTTPTITDVNQIRARQTLLDERVRDGVTAPGEAIGLTPISGVTVRNEATSGGTAPAVVAAITNAALLETSGDNTPRELSSVPASPTGVSVAYTVPHPWENDQNLSASGCGANCGFGRSYLAWRSAFNARDTVNDGFWAIGMRGNRNEYNAFEPALSNTSRFHITSTQLDTSSFPGLGDVEDAQFDYAVSFHGQGSSGVCEPGVMVGGRLGMSMGLSADTRGWRRGIAENIRTLVDPADPVAGCNSTSSCFGPLDPAAVRYTTGACPGFDVGEGTANFVNEIADQGGIQLEIGRDLDQAIYGRIGAAVHEVFDCLNEAPNVNIGDTSYWFALTNSTGTAYATDGRCRGFVVDANFRSYAASAFYAGLQTCTVGARVHLDVYRENAAGAWDRVAGGTRTYTSCSPTQVFTDEAYDDLTTDSIVPQFQHALTGSTAGRYRVVVYGYSGTHFNATNALAVWAKASG
jgi:hypothetical protein